VTLTTSTKYVGLETQCPTTTAHHVANIDSGKPRVKQARYVFNGAGGAALLFAAGIRHSRAKASNAGFRRAVFPCIPPTLKWSRAPYRQGFGLAAEGAPPMSVPAP